LILKFAPAKHSNEADMKVQEKNQRTLIFLQEMNYFHPF